jgi:subtilisin family serine protease
MLPQRNGSSGNSNNEYEINRETITTRLDPELQRILIELRSGRPVDSTLREELADGAIVIDVVAKLEDPNIEVPGLNVVQKIGPIVTATLTADQIESVRRNRNVKSLKVAAKLRSMLSNSVPEIRASRQQIMAKLSSFFDPGSFADVDGSGVIIGIVDTGCDIAHPHFRRGPRHPKGDTRILYLWDQRGGKTDNSPKGFGYGREFSSRDINEAIKSNPAAPHQALGYEVPSAAHGTRVMDIAAGGGSGENPPGVAPKADIIFVDAFLGYEFESEDSFGNSRHLLEAVKYIFDKAVELQKRAVVNISLNYDCGPHDGSTPIEEGFDLLLEVPGRAIVIAAGNSHGSHRHVRTTVHPRIPCTIGWNLLSNDQSSNKVSLWYPGKHKLELTLVSPRGETVGPFPLNSAFTIKRNGERGGYVFHRRKDPSNGDNHIVVIFTTLMEEGRWKLVLTPPEKQFFAPYDVHAWIEFDEGTASQFVESETDDSYTIGALSCGHSIIAVGSYDALDPAMIDSKSAEGPTRDGRQKPEVSAPGLNVRAARALSGGVDEDSGGTSNAAPHVAGLIALLMQDAPRNLTNDEIRAVVMASARQNPPSESSVWDPRYGRGRVNVAEALIEQKKIAPAPDLRLREREVIAVQPLQPLSDIELLERLRNDRTSTALLKFNAAFSELSRAIANPSAPAVNGHTNAEDLSPAPVTQPRASKGHAVAQTNNLNPNNDEPAP